MGLGYCATPIVFVMKSFLLSYYAMLPEHPRILIKYERVQWFCMVSYVHKGLFPFQAVLMKGCVHGGLCWELAVITKGCYHCRLC